MVISMLNLTKISAKYVYIYAVHERYVPHFLDIQSFSPMMVNFNTNLGGKAQI